MGVDITEESKNNVTLSLADKDATLTWEESDPQTWSEGNSKWAAPGRHITKEDKNNNDLTLESKN